MKKVHVAWLSALLLAFSAFAFSLTSAFGAWVNPGSENVTLTTVGDTTQITASTDRVSAHKAVAKIGSTYYTSIERAVADANSAGSSTTVYVIPGTNPTIKKSFTIASNVTLVMPYSGETYYTKPTNTSAGNNISMPDDSNAKLKVTLAKNVVVNNNGTIIVGGTIRAGAGAARYAGQTYGDFAQLIMSDQSKIACASGSKFEVYGYVTEATKHAGDYADDASLSLWPQIDFSSGSKLYAPFVIHDFRGGSVSSALYDDRSAKNVLFFNEYQVLNIHPLMNFAYGSEMLVNTWLSATGGPFGTENIKLIGNSGQHLFQMSAGASLNFKYNFSTTISGSNYETKRHLNFMDIRLHGDFSLNSMTLDIAGVSLDTSSYRFCLSYLFHIRLYGGTTTITNKCKMMGGCKVIVAPGAKLAVSDLIAYRSYTDATDSHTQYPTAAAAPILEVNGTIEAGKLAGVVTASAASATLTVTGAASITSYEHLNHTGSSFFTSATYTTIVETLSVYLIKNGSASDTLTDIGTGTYHSYKDASNKVGWYTNAGKISYNSNGSSSSFSDRSITIGSTGYAITPSDLSNTPTRLHYDFGGWYYDPACTQKATAGDAIFSSVTLYAKWTPVVYTISYVCNTFAGGAQMTETVTIDSRNPTSFTVETPSTALYPATAGDNIFDGWYTDSGFTNKVSAVSGSLLSSMSAPYSLTLYGQWYPSGTETYVITFSNSNTDEGCTCVASQDVISTNVSSFVPPDLTGKNNDRKYQKYFDGWYLDSGFQTKYTSPSQITGSMTFYARWLTKSTITILWSGSALVNVIQYVPKNYSFTIPDVSEYGVGEMPTGYQAAWTISGGPLNGTKHYQGESITITDNWGQNITVTGSQEAISYTLTIKVGKNETGKYTIKRGSSTIASNVSISAGGTATPSVQINDVVTFTVTANSDYTAGAISQTNCSKSGNNFTITGANPTITAADATKNSGGGCLLAGTMVTMADGTTRPIEQIKVGDYIQSWNFETGTFEPQPVMFVEESEIEDEDVMYVRLSDGSELPVRVHQALFDVDQRDYFLLDQSTIHDSIGRKIMTSALGIRESATIVDITIERRVARHYALLTAYNYNYIANGIISSDGLVSYKCFFDVDESYKYDPAKMRADIETYGLYTYEEWSAYLTPTQFELLNAKYYKVAVGKGYITKEQIIHAISVFVSNSSVR